MNRFGRITASASQVFILIVGMICFAGLVGIMNTGRVEGADPSFLSALFTIGESTPNNIDGLKGWFIGDQHAIIDTLGGAVAWAAAAYMAAELLGGLFGFEDGEQEAFSLAAASGFGAGAFMYGWQEASSLDLLAGEAWWTGELGKGYLGYAAWAVVAAAVVFYLTYEEESTKTVTFTCEPWDAPTGGRHCEKCNKQKGGLPCSEYQCRSLGQSCQLLNPGTGEEKCAWVNRKDVSAPVITLWKDVLTEGYEYLPTSATHPEDRGTKVVLEGSTTGCIRAFTPFAFGIHTDEPAKCRIDYERKPEFEEMQFFFGGSPIFKYNHTQVMALPGTTTLVNGSAESLEIQNDGQYNLFVRCADSNGNENVGNFVFKFCVEKGPDTTPPLIAATNLINGMPVAYNQTTVDLKVYVNEPSECKWSHLDEEYKDMEEEMSCSRRAEDFNAQLLYECETTLSGIKDRVDNKFYFRCKDQPGAAAEERNTNSESYEFTLVGTQPLVIKEVGPNETVKDSTDPVKVVLTAETLAGHNEGEATCSYSKEEDGNYIQFFNTNSHEHSQDLYLSEEENDGEYTYYIKCVDLGGNFDIKSVEFEVESDDSAPVVARAYHEESHLKLVTNEDAECVYSLDSCDFLYDDGVKMTTVGDTEHFTDWDTKKTLYVKCKDEYGNQPTVDANGRAACSIVVRAFEELEPDEE